MIKYITFATFSSWHEDLRKEIRDKLIKSGAKISEKDWISLTNKLTRKHIGFEYSGSENRKSLYRNALWYRPQAARLKESIIKINIINQKKFTYFLLKYSKKAEFIDESQIIM